MDFVIRPDNVTTFDRVCRGDLFKFNKQIYMRTEDIMDPDGYTYNCVNIKDGMIRRFSMESNVIPVKYELVIK